MTGTYRFKTGFYGLIYMKQAATLATTPTSISDHKLANELSKWWDIESYASNCHVTGHSKEEQRAITQRAVNNAIQL